MPDIDDDIPEANDAIPKGSISLTHAYNCVVGAVSNHHERLPKFDEDWSEALRKSREEERNIQDSEVFDKELEEEWHRRKEANLFLRLEIEAKRLVACIRDPETGEILQLRSDDWIPTGWDDYIPPGIWTDYVRPDDYEAPGPKGTLIRGALRPVFFMRDEFEAWFKQIFGETESVVAKSELNPAFQNFRRTHGHRRAAVKEAIRAIWGRNGIPHGVTEGSRLKQINDWLKGNGRVPVTEATIRRALKELRSERS